MRKWLILLASVLVLLPVIFLFWLGSSERALQWAYLQLRDGLPGDLVVGDLSGRLLGPITLADLSYRDDSGFYQLRQLTLDWQPASLLSGRLVISRIESAGLRVQPQSREESTELAPVVPEIRLPLIVEIDQLSISDIQFENKNSLVDLETVEARLLLDQQVLDIDTRVQQSASSWAKLTGTIQLEPELPHELVIGWQSILSPYGEFRGSGQLTGSLALTNLRHQLRGPLTANLDITVEEPTRDFNWYGSLQLDDFDSSLLVPDMPTTRGAVQISARGNLQRASASGKLNIAESPYGKVSADFEIADIRPDLPTSELAVDGLVVTHLDNRVAASGTLQWSPQIAWQADLSTADFNPAAYQAAWPGRIDAVVAVSGIVEEQQPSVGIEIKSFSGELREYPLALAGQATWQNNVASLRDIQLVSGGTQVKLAGTVADSLNLQWLIVSDNLDELVPGTGGSVKAEGQLDGPIEEVALRLTLSASELVYRDLSAQSADASASMELDLLQLSATDMMQGQVNVELENILVNQQPVQRLALRSDGKQLVSQIKTPDLIADLQLSGSLDGDSWLGKLKQASLQHAEYGTWSLQSPTTLRLSDSKLELAEACLSNPRTGDFCLQVTSSGNTSQADFNLQNLPLGLLEPWLPGAFALQGVANASAALSYDGQQNLLGQLDVDLPPGQLFYEIESGKRNQLAYQALRINTQLKAGGISVSLDSRLQGENQITATANLPGARLIGLDIENQRLEAKLQAALQQLDFIDDVLPEVESLQGHMDMTLQLQGLLIEPSVTGRALLSDASLNLPRLGLQVSGLNLETTSEQANQFKHQLQAQLAGGTVVASGRTSLGKETPWSTELSVRAEQLAIAQLLRSRLPQDVDIEGPLNATLAASIRAPDQLLARLELELPQGQVRYPLPENEQGEWLYRDGLIVVDMNAAGASVRSGIGIGDNFMRSTLQLPGLSVFDFNPEAQVVQGDVAIELSDLSLIELLVADMQRGSGKFDASITVAGTVASLQLDTTARLQDAAVDLPGLGLNLRQINLRANTAANGITQLSGSLFSGEGELLIDGEVELDRELDWPGSLRLKGDNVELLKTPEAVINASPDIRIEFANRDIVVSGEVLIPYARIRPSDMSTAVRVSRDAVIIGEESQQQAPWNLQSQVRISLGDRVDFYGYGFECRLEGSLLVEESPDQPTRGTGEIRVIEGRYRAYGQFLNIDNGKLLFSGGPLVDPGLDMQAVRQTNGVVAGVNVSGRLRAPRLDLFSIPAMGQTDALSYLLTGGPLETATRGEGATMASAALALGLTGGDRIARSLGEQFGIDEMRIENSSSGDQASLVMGRYLSPRLYISYGVGLIESVNTINFRYSITEAWQLEAQSGESQGVDLIFGFER